MFVMCALATKYAWDMHQSKSTELGLKLDLFYLGESICHVNALILEIFSKEENLASKGQGSAFELLTKYLISSDISMYLHCRLIA